MLLVAGNRQMGGPQAEKGRHLGGVTERISDTRAPLPLPDCPEETHPLFVLCGLVFLSLGCRERMHPHFHKQLNAGAFGEGLSLIWTRLSRNDVQGPFQSGD